MDSTKTSFVDFPKTGLKHELKAMFGEIGTQGFQLIAHIFQGDHLEGLTLHGLSPAWVRADIKCLQTSKQMLLGQGIELPEAIEIKAELNQKQQLVVMFLGETPYQGKAMWKHLLIKPNGELKLQYKDGSKTPFRLDDIKPQTSTFSPPENSPGE